MLFVLLLQSVLVLTFLYFPLMDSSEFVFNVSMCLDVKDWIIFWASREGCLTPSVLSAVVLSYIVIVTYGNIVQSYWIRDIILNMALVTNSFAMD